MIYSITVKTFQISLRCTDVSIVGTRAMVSHDGLKKLVVVGRRNGTGERIGSGRQRKGSGE